MRTLQSQAVVWGFITILAASCTDTDFQTGKPGDVPYPTLHTTLLFTSGDSPATRGAVSSRQETVDIWFGDADSSVRLQGDRPDTRAGEADAAQVDDVQNVCVFQVNPTDGKLMHSEYHDTGIQTSPEGDKSIDIALRTDMATCELYVLANVGDLTGGFSIGTSTRDDIQSLVVDRTEAQQSEMLNGNLPPLSGIARDISLTDIPLAVPVQMQRTVAQIDLNLTHDGNFKFHAVTLHNVPRKMNLFEPADTTAADTYSLRYFPVKSDNAGTPITATWYMPENKRGAGSVPAGNWKQRNEDHAPVGSSFLQISGLYHDGTASEDVEVVYIVLIGSAGDANDFNVKRNTRYTLNISINSCDTVADGRIIRVIDLSEPGTANCYLTNKTHWWYKLKGTVRGNGAATDADISPTGQALAQDAKIAPQAAELVWETKGHRQVIQQVEWPGNGNEYVYFKTGHSVQGNAVIAVKDRTEAESSNVLWSWHIWKTDFDLSEMNANHTHLYETSPKTVSGFATLSPRTLRVMDRNLGAEHNRASNTEDVVGAFGLLWQFGRKDPFPAGKSTTENGLISLYDKEGNEITSTMQNTRNSEWWKPVLSGTIQEGIATAIQNPQTVYLSLTDGNWMSAANRGAGMASHSKMWGCESGGSNLRFNDRFVGKTIYDPCPAGWCVAPQDTWSNFIKDIEAYNIRYSAYGKYVNAVPEDAHLYDSSWGAVRFDTEPVFGKRFYYDKTASEEKTVFYPAVGTYLNGRITDSGVSVMVLPSGANSNSPDKDLFVVNTRAVYTAHSWYGELPYSIRCVREEDALANKHLEPAP